MGNGRRRRHGDGLMRLTPFEVETVRRRQFNARRTRVNAEQAQLDFDAYILEMEAKYGVIGKNASLDMQTGVITIGEETN